MRARDVPDEIGEGTGRNGAPHVATAEDRRRDPYLSADSIVYPELSTNPRIDGWQPRDTQYQPSRNPSAVVAAILSAVMHALRDGADSAALGDTRELTYAQGWTAASTLAQLAAADAMAAIIRD